MKSRHTENLCFYTDAVKITGLTDHYIALMEEALAGAGIGFSQKSHPCRRDLLLEGEIIPAFFRMLTGYRHVALWVQGIVPEESYLRHGSSLRRAVLSRMERYVLRRCRFVFFCSAAMREHYESKYHLSFAGRSFLMPCFGTDAIFPEAFSAEKYHSLTFAYIGSLSEWQCFRETASFYREIETACRGASRFYVFTKEREKANAILQEVGVRHAEVASLEGKALQERLAGIRYGFVLRRADAVNRVATPTKLSLYLSCGVIPIYSPILRDFTENAPRELGIPVEVEAMSTSRVLADIQTPRDPMQMQMLCAKMFETYYGRDHYRDAAERALSLCFDTMPRSGKRLLFLLNRMETGGIPRALCALLREIAPRFSVDLCFFAGGAMVGEIPDGVRILPVPPLLAATEVAVSEIGTLPLRAAIFRALGAVWTRFFGKGLPFALLCRMERHHFTEYDAVISFCQPLPDRIFGNICHELALSLTAPRKLTFLHADFEKYGGNTRRNRRLYRGFDRILAVSRAGAESFCHVMPTLTNRVHIMPNLTEPERIRALATVENVPALLHPAIVSVSRLSPEKGLVRALPVMARLRDEGISFAWYLVGEGSCREELARDIRCYHLEDRVFLLGARENPYPLLASADFLFLPSVHEASPVVVDEALALGVPVLATCAGDVAEKIGPFGVVCAQNPASLFCALSDFLKEERYRTCRPQKGEIMQRSEARRVAAREAFEEALVVPETKKKVPAWLSRKVDPVLPACGALLLALTLRDGFGLALGRPGILFLIGLSLLMMDVGQTMRYTVFLMPLFSALPSNYVVMLLLWKYGTLALSRNTRLRVPPSLLLSGMATAGYVLMQVGLSGGELHVAFSFGAELLLLVLLASDIEMPSARAITRLYVVAVFTLGTLSLLLSIRENGAEMILSGAVRFGDIYFSTTGIHAAVDPNFLGFFCIAGMAAVAELLRRRKMPCGEAMFFLAALGFFGVIGLSRSFLICLAVLLLLEGLAWARTPAGLCRFVAFSSAFGGGAFLLLRRFMPSLLSHLIARFTTESLAGANGRMALLSKWSERFFSKASSLLFGVGLFETNVHATCLQIVFGLGFVGGALLLLFTAAFAKANGWQRKSGSGGIPIFVTLLMSMTIPAARMLGAYFPLIFVVLFGAAVQKDT